MTYGLLYEDLQSSWFQVTVGLLTVRVRNSATLRPIVGAVVTVDEHSRTTTLEGLATFSLPYGTYTVRASRFDYESGSWSVTLGAPIMEVDARLTKLTVPPPETGIVFGQVRDAETLAPIEGALVICDTHSVYTGPEGYYAFALGYGGYIVKASKSGYASQAISVTLSSLEMQQNFNLEPTKPISAAVIAVGAVAAIAVAAAAIAAKGK